MRELKRLLVLIGLICLLSGFTLVVACSDEEGYDSKKSLGTVDNQTYKDQCGACHLVYQPALLPSGSWHKILSDLEDHHGESVVIEGENLNVIRAYLKEGAAEHSFAKRAKKIIRSLDWKTPERISEVPYIQRKHHDIKEDVFKRESIGSRANCIACHSTAESGVYEEDYVRIPE